MLLGFFHSLHQQLTKIEVNRQLLELRRKSHPQEEANDDTMNPPELNILAEFFPGLDERAINAALLALLPIPVVLDTFIH